MKFIGITGGVGAGKSAILSYLAGKDGVRVMLADEIAHDLMERKISGRRMVILTAQSLPLSFSRMKKKGTG